MGQPRISILIPNYNNGRTSSRNGCRDFIGDLFQSLMRTLADDPTPLEIIVADDGSTDDSLATCRQWANRSWRGWRRGAAPAFFAQDDPRTFPVEDGTVDAVLVFDALETHPNPVALLSEAHRVLAEGGTLAIIARERTTPLGDDYDALHAYRPHELLMQVQGCGWFEPLPIEPSRPIPATVALVARRRSLAVKSGAAPAARPGASLSAP